MNISGPRRSAEPDAKPIRNVTNPPPQIIVDTYPIDNIPTDNVSVAVVDTHPEYSVSKNRKYLQQITNTTQAHSKKSYYLRNVHNT